MQEGVGGKLHLFVSSLPKLGVHGLTPRQAGPSSNSQQKQTVLQAAHKGFQTMAEDAAEHQVQYRQCRAPMWANTSAIQQAWVCGLAHVLQCQRHLAATAKQCMGQAWLA